MRCLSLGFACLLLTLSTPTHGYSASFLKYFSFSKKSVLKLWKEKLQVGRVDYRFQKDKVGGHVKANAKSAASGLYYEIKYNPQKKPYISWKWKVDQFPKKDPEDKEGIKEDFAARIYVIFPANVFIFSRCLEYIWDDILPEGTITKSPISSRIRLFVLRSGPEKGWIHEERNIFKDYLEAFGEDPDEFDDEVGAIAFMTDTDDSQSHAISHFDDIKIGYAKPILKK